MHTRYARCRRPITALLTSGYVRSTAHCFLLTTHSVLLATCYVLLTTCHLLLTAYYSWLLTAHCVLSTATAYTSYCLLLAAFYSRLTTYYSLLITYCIALDCPLPTAHRPPPTTRCLLLTSYLLHASLFLTNCCLLLQVPILPTSNADELRCITPSFVGATLSAPVAFSLNAQQYTADQLNFTAYLPHVVSTASPSSGPAAGGTNVTLVGGPFSGGSDHRCRFASAGSSADPDATQQSDWRTLVPATVYAERINSTALVCVTPQRPLSYRAEIEVTLNGQQYSAGQPFEFTAGPLLLTSLSPTSGCAMIHSHLDEQTNTNTHPRTPTHHQY